MQAGVVNTNRPIMYTFFHGVSMYMYIQLYYRPHILFLTTSLDKFYLVKLSGREPTPFLSTGATEEFLYSHVVHMYCLPCNVSLINKGRSRIFGGRGLNNVCMQNVGPCLKNANHAHLSQ